MIQNGTNVTCYTPNVASLLIIKQGNLPIVVYDWDSNIFRSPTSSYG